MKSVELEHEGLEIKFYETTTEHAQKYGLKASKPIFFNHLLIDKKKRNRGNGKALLKMVEEYAEKNNCDLIFGHIPNDAEFTKDSRICFFSDIEMIKNWLHKNGYAIIPENNDFHKVIKIQKPLRFYGGIGFANCSELGVYEVRTELEERKFNKLSDARFYYESKKGEKAIWDLDNNELIDSWYRI
jgi:GNAT superfamily N-acetyltransferase